VLHNHKRQTATASVSGFLKPSNPCTFAHLVGYDVLILVAVAVVL